jgi:hypothetical protein
MFLGILKFSIFQNNKNEHLIKLTIKLLTQSKIEEEIKPEVKPKAKKEKDDKETKRKGIKKDSVAKKEGNQNTENKHFKI